MGSRRAQNGKKKFLKKKPAGSNIPKAQKIVVGGKKKGKK